MSSQTVVLRRPDRLAVLVSTKKEPQAWELVEQPLAEAPLAVRSRHARVLEAWSALGDARQLDADTLTRAVTLMVTTLPSPGRWSGAGLPVHLRRDRQVRQAQPWDRRRVWMRPPRERRPKAVDLRPHLCDAKFWSAIQPRLHAQAEAVARRLERAGFPPGCLWRIRDAADPYLAYQHGAPPGVTLARLPARFVGRLLPLLSGLSWAHVRQALGLFWSLQLDSDDVALGGVAQLLGGPRPVWGLAWGCWLAGFPMPERHEVLEVLLERRARDIDPSRLSPAAHTEALASADSEMLVDRVRHILRCLDEGRPLEPTLHAFQVAREHTPGFRFERRVTSAVRYRDVDEPVGRPGLGEQLERVLKHALSEGEYNPRFVAELCVRCYDTPGVAELLWRPSLLQHPPNTVRRILWPFIDLWLTPDGRGRVEEVAGLLEERLRAVPEELHARLLRGFYGALDNWYLGPQVLLALDLLPRIVGRLSDDDCDNLNPLWSLVAAATDTEPDRLRSAPERSLRRLAAELAREGWSSSLRFGLATLRRSCPELVLDAFASHPDALFRSARLLGEIWPARRRRFVRELRQHALMQPDLLERPLAELVPLLSSLAAPGCTNPVPRRLREHVAGRVRLSAASVARHRQAIARRLVPARLGWLRELVLSDLRWGLPDEGERDPAWQHALRMLGFTSENRRILRRLLRATAAGARDFVWQHPANRTWLRRHPRVPARLWAGEFAREEELSGVGRLRLALEPHPLEALRLGTLAGSCLAAGGCNGDSAVAAAVDVNKRVVYARSDDETVVARQLVAISESDRLVCFAVYPRNASDEIEDAFLDYDHALAYHLGLELERGAADDYEVAKILVREWYDDGLWKRLATAGEGGA